MYRFLYISLLVLATITSCTSRHVAPQEFSGETVNLSYAKGFSIIHTDSFTVVTVNHPWKPGEIYARYYLVKDKSTSTPSDGATIQIPIKSMMVNSATHLGFLEMLGSLDKIKGVCNASYIYNPTILREVNAGQVQDLGDSYNLDIERLLLLQPQVVMTTAYNAEDENTKRLRQSGLNVIYNIEWQEPSILGRTEWIKFIGAFLDKEQMADSLFQSISDNYEELKYEVAQHRDLNQPTIFSGQDYRGTWSLPGGNSYSAQLFRDAGAAYPYANDSSAVSISSTIEEAMIKFSKNDIWVGVQENSLEELAQRDSRYTLFDAYKNGNVYNTNKRINATGGNDYWEGAVARPDLLLKDMVKICHPELLPDYELTYMNQLQ